MTRIQVSIRRRPLSRRNAELLAADIFGTKRLPPARPTKPIITHRNGKRPINRKKAEELAAEILGWKADFQEERRKGGRRRQLRKRLVRRRQGKEQKRCWDWMLHQGNVHYACNASSFPTYTKLTSTHSERLGLGTYGAIGIGTVNLAAPRAYGAPDVCTITLFDVLHVPSMPCNGISTLRMAKAGTDVLLGEWRSVATHGPSKHMLFEARRMLGAARRSDLDDLHRLCLGGSE